MGDLEEQIKQDIKHAEETLQQTGNIETRKIITAYIDAKTEDLALVDGKLVVEEEKLRKLLAEFPECENCKYFSKKPISDELGGCMIKTCSPRKEWANRLKNVLLGVELEKK